MIPAAGQPGGRRPAPRPAEGRGGVYVAAHSSSPHP